MKIYLIGTGMGGGKNLTAEAEKACREAEIFIGAKRILNDFNKFGKPEFVSYKSDEICQFADLHNEYKSAAVLLSGDISFYSAAQKLRQELGGHKIIPVAGISSLSYMCAKLGVPLKETEIVSLHGKENSFVCRVRDRKFVFMLLNGTEDIKKIADTLRFFGMGRCIIHIGSRLGYEDESILSMKADEFRNAFEAPVCAVIENPKPMNASGMHIPDSEFIRGGVPMTKSSVRAVSIAQLRLKNESVLYDIGAGTGSIAVEASLRSHDIRVYAVERNAEALCILRKNIYKFGADNIAVVEGEAPEAMEKLPRPTHVFIGGSGGKSGEIIEAALKKNPHVRIVMNAVTLNSCSAALSFANRFGLKMSAVCINASESKEAGSSLLMMAQNPVYIFTLEAEKDD